MQDSIRFDDTPVGDISWVCRAATSEYRPYDRLNNGKVGIFV